MMWHVTFTLPFAPAGRPLTWETTVEASDAYDAYVAAGSVYLERFDMLPPSRAASLAVGPTPQAS